MKFYLSSYKLGDQVEKLKGLIPNNKIGYIPNALDFSNIDLERKKWSTEMDMETLRRLGLEVELLDLREYFKRESDLKKKVNDLKAVFISGGNTFVLRQAMKLSGLDTILSEIKQKGAPFLYSGYSAAGCVISPSLKTYQIVDVPNEKPYDGWDEIIWEGLGFIDFAFMPHWDSAHPESSDIDKEIKYCKERGIKYKAIRDGDVIIIE